MTCLIKLVNKIKLYHPPDKRFPDRTRPAGATSIQPGAERSGTLGIDIDNPRALQGQKHKIYGI